MPNRVMRRVLIIQDQEGTKLYKTSARVLPAAFKVMIASTLAQKGLHGNLVNNCREKTMAQMNTVVYRLTLTEEQVKQWTRN